MHTEVPAVLQEDWQELDMGQKLNTDWEQQQEFEFESKEMAEATGAWELSREEQLQALDMSIVEP